MLINVPCKFELLHNVRCLLKQGRMAGELGEMDLELREEGDTGVEVVAGVGRLEAGEHLGHLCHLWIHRQRLWRGHALELSVTTTPLLCCGFFLRVGLMRGGGCCHRRGNRAI
uniref:Uncharacterized protein n=1 Tax=Zea mays TaxID=4577 RepID=C4J2L2_MAIZE|nr:unknown [Zea mays]